ncbi:MAG: CRISPR system precrRNA processing endoribonuclease RAMP protein Cas6, partial [Chloroflexi bacterium]
TLYREPGEVVSDRLFLITQEAVWERAQALAPEQVTLHFLTPTRLKRGGRFVTQGPPFPVLMRALLRRLTALAALHGPRPWKTDFGALVEAAEGIALVGEGAGWQDWRRTSRRQGRRMNLGGLVGEATYRGDLTPFHPLLALGEIVHVGKATVFGDGWYVME